MIDLEQLVEVARVEARLQEERRRRWAAAGVIQGAMHKPLRSRVLAAPLALTVGVLRAASGALERAAGMLDALCQPSPPPIRQIHRISSPTSTG
jgi:hypothetical protein